MLKSRPWSQEAHRVECSIAYRMRPRVKIGRPTKLEIKARNTAAADGKSGCRRRADRVVRSLEDIRPQSALDSAGRSGVAAVAGLPHRYRRELTKAYSPGSV
jgi:hypothetical protein